jgi:hypothetical protein
MKILISILAIIAAALTAPSCGIPVAIVVDGQHGSYSYSSKSGLTATIHADK